MEKKIITARDIFLNAKTAFGSNRKFICGTLFLGVYLPLLLLGLILDYTGISMAQRLRDNAFDVRLQDKRLLEILNEIVPYFSSVGLTTMAIYFVITVSYFIITNRVVAWVSGTTFKDSPAKMVPSAIKGSFALLFFIAVVSIIAQVALLPAVFVICLATMFPVLQIAEERGSLKSIWNAVTIKYVRSRPISGWNVFFNLITIGAFCYTIFVLFAFLGEFALFADTYVALPSVIWTANFPGTDLTFVYLLLSLVESFVVATLLGSMSVLTTSLYFLIRKSSVLAVA